MYEAFTRRKVADELASKRAMEIAACWGNSNLDSNEDKELRQKYMDAIDKNYSQAIESLYEETKPGTTEKKIKTEDPFFKAADKGLKKKGLPGLIKD